MFVWLPPQLLHLGRDYPKGYDYFRSRLKAAFLKNRDVKDPEQLTMLLARGQYIIKELEALYMLKKYLSPNTCKHSYGSGLPASRVSTETLDRGLAATLLAPAVLGGGPSSLITPGFSSTVCPWARFPTICEVVVNGVDWVSITSAPSLEASGSVSADAVSASLAATSPSVGWCP
ncbi:hypothetical protein HPB50_028673 [Hyalomma asiaticum]|nr:hypothetical protein HPB50_028673 [Hyalomma asiaticum]